LHAVPAKIAVCKEDSYFTFSPRRRRKIHPAILYASYAERRNEENCGRRYPGTVQYFRNGKYSKSRKIIGPGNQYGKQQTLCAYYGTAIDMPQGK
jgi:histidinol dehydrogenase